MLGYKKSLNAIVAGAVQVNGSYKCVVGFVQTDKGKEKEIIVSAKTPAGCKSKQEAIDAYAELPYSATDKKTWFRVSLPKTYVKGESRIILSPFMNPARLAVFFAIADGLNPPATMDEETFANHAVALGLVEKEIVVAREEIADALSK